MLSSSHPGKHEGAWAVSGNTVFRTHTHQHSGMRAGLGQQRSPCSLPPPSALGMEWRGVLMNEHTWDASILTLVPSFSLWPQQKRPSVVSLSSANPAGLSRLHPPTLQPARGGRTFPPGRGHDRTYLHLPKTKRHKETYNAPSSPRPSNFLKG